MFQTCTNCIFFEQGRLNIKLVDEFMEFVGQMNVWIIWVEIANLCFRTEIVEFRIESKTWKYTIIDKIIHRISWEISKDQIRSEERRVGKEGRAQRPRDPD